VSDPTEPPLDILMYQATWLMGITEADAYGPLFASDTELVTEHLRADADLPVTFEEDIRMLQSAGASIVDIMTVIREATWVLVDDYTEPGEQYETSFGECARDQVWRTIVDGIVGRLNARSTFAAQQIDAPVPYLPVT